MMGIKKEKVLGRGVIQGSVVVEASMAGIGQSSSVMLDQKTQSMTTDKRVKRVWKRAPSILPSVPLQRCVLMTY